MRREGETLDTAKTAGISVEESSQGTLERYYGLVVTRMLHEYDQRDRDFIMHVTINGGLFAAVGFVLTRLRIAAVGSWVFAGIGLLLVGFVGVQAGRALLGSVVSFRYYQSVMNATLVRLETAILPDPRFGCWSQSLVRREDYAEFLEPELQKKLSHLKVAGPSVPVNLVGHREKLARVVIAVWTVVVALGLMLLVAAALAGMGLVSHAYVMARWSS